MPTILFLHGAGMDHSVWTLQARWFARHGCRTLLPDLPGHGRDHGAPLGRIEDMAAWAGDLLAAERVDDAWLVGHSMGALLALETAAALPERVKGLCLLGAAASMPVHAALLAATVHAPKLAAALMVSWGMGPRGHRGGSAMPGFWLMGAGRRLIERTRPEVLRADLHACDSYAGGEAAATRIRCPCLVLIGTRDRMTPPRAGHRLTGLIQGAVARELPECGHMAMSEHPDAVLDALAGFIPRQPTPSPAP